MGAFRRNNEEDEAGAASYPLTKSDVVPALGRHDLPNLWVEDEDEETEETGPTGSMLPGVRTRRTPHLTIMKGLNAGLAVPIDERWELVVGRSASAGIKLIEDGISRRHCAFTRRNGAVFVEDLGSTNGTIVNGSRITVATELQPGDRVQLGPNAILQLGVFDATEESLARKLYDALTRDALTRAHNRRNFDERLAAEVAYAHRHKTTLSVLLIDVDHIKALNSAAGREAGDEVLKAVATIVGETVRTCDLVHRYSGTKFALLVRDTLKSSTRLAERIRARVGAHRVPFGTKQLNVSVSIGIAENGERGAQLSGEGLVRLAHKRLEAAKSLGRICAE